MEGSMKTLMDLWEENGRKRKGLRVKSPTNQTPSYQVLMVIQKKNLVILRSRGKGFRGWFRWHYDAFVANNPRWEKV